VQESEDLAQETFITAWQRLGELRDVEKLPAWLCGIARNLANNWIRRTQLERQARTETALENVAAPCLEETDSAESERESQIALLWATLKEIPMQFRDPLLHFLCGFISKCHGEDTVRLYSASYKSCDAMGDGMCFTCSCSCENEQRTGQCFNGGFLSGI